MDYNKGLIFAIDRKPIFRRTEKGYRQILVVGKKENIRIHLVQWSKGGLGPVRESINADDLKSLDWKIMDKREDFEPF